jgi:hypothetical protein
MGVFRKRSPKGVQPLVRDAEALRAKIDGMRLRINAFVANIEREFYVIEETMKEVEQAVEAVCRDLDQSSIGGLPPPPSIGEQGPQPRPGAETAED